MSSLIKASDRFFVAGARGMAGSGICRALHEKGYGDQAKGGALLMPTREELDLLNYEDVKRWYGEQKHEHFQIKSFDDDDDGGHSTEMIPVKSNMSEVSDKMKKNCRAEQDEIGMESYRRAQIAREQGVWDKEVMIMMVMVMTTIMVMM